MHIVGTDEITVRDGRSVPAGHQHAVDINGRVLCRSARARFTWPGMTWAEDEDGSCPLCVQVRRAQHVFAAPVEHAYPHAPSFPAAPIHPPVPAYASLPAQGAAPADEDDAVFAEPTDSVA